MISTSQFTRQELTCLSLLAQGLSYPEAAVEMSITERTIKQHIQNMKEKCQVKNLFQLGLIYGNLVKATSSTPQ